jgi:hypothetical protein
MFDRRITQIRKFDTLILVEKLLQDWNNSTGHIRTHPDFLQVAMAIKSGPSLVRTILLLE